MKSKQLTFSEHIPNPRKRTREEIIEAVRALNKYHEQGILGGEEMPEDSNPGLEKESRLNFHYFSLPMALNFQRNSYALWKSALATFNDESTRFVFKPEDVFRVSDDELRTSLTKYKVALQPTRHINIWRRISDTLYTHYDSDVRTLFSNNDFIIPKILEEIQVKRKKEFPYLSGPKIANYWLYVMLNYTSASLRNKEYLSIAPDTHVIQASIVLGVVEDSGDQGVLRETVAEEWKKILEDTEFSPIDVHTPLWLWSRQNFHPNV